MPQHLPAAIDRVTIRQPAADADLLPAFQIAAVNTGDAACRQPPSMHAPACRQRVRVRKSACDASAMSSSTQAAWQTRQQLSGRGALRQQRAMREVCACETAQRQAVQPCE